MIEQTVREIPLSISRSVVTTEGNKTGSWRFLRPVYDEKTAPCSAACPAGEDIARIEMLVARQMFKSAWETILMENPFPAVCGRVCFHTCEAVCNRGKFDQALGIHNLERFVGDMAIAEKFQMPVARTPENKKRVAIAGAGPAGLAAAYFLSRLGHACDIFESKSEPGGVLRWGIPQYRLPDDVLKHEIDRIINMGVQLFCNTSVDQNFIQNAKGKYDAVFMGCGYGRSLEMKIPGEEMAQDGLEFLYRIRQGDRSLSLGNGKIAVIGGGNTAIDVARSLIRTGAKPVIVYRRRRQDMPAFGHETEMALSEGVELMELLAPVRIEKKDNGYVLFLQKMKPADTGTDGRTRVIPDGEKTEILDVGQIFTAIGAEAEENWYVPSQKQENILNLSHCTVIKQDIPIVFGGDLTNPVKSVTDAIASGKAAAMALDTFFSQNHWNDVEKYLEACRVGDGNALSMEIYLDRSRNAKSIRTNRNRHVIDFDEINTDYFQSSPRLMPSLLSPDESIRSFAEIEQVFSKDSAIQEAQRCFNCGICNDCDNCRLFCPELAVMSEQSDTTLSRQINLDYCKGCGICVVECPRNAMILKEESI